MSQRNPNNDRSQKQRTEGVSGMTRKGASRAKPVSQAGSTVQVVERRSKTRSKANPATLSKEENGRLATHQMKFIRNLEMALVRIENKTYGICKTTGKLIPKERLMKVPHATECIEAKESRR